MKTLGISPARYVGGSCFVVMGLELHWRNCFLKQTEELLDCGTFLLMSVSQPLNFQVYRAKLVNMGFNVIKIPNRFFNVLCGSSFLFQYKRFFRGNTYIAVFNSVITMRDLVEVVSMGENTNTVKILAFISQNHLFTYNFASEGQSNAFAHEETLMLTQLILYYPLQIGIYAHS